MSYGIDASSITPNEDCVNQKNSLPKLYNYNELLSMMLCNTKTAHMAT